MATFLIYLTLITQVIFIEAHHTGKAPKIDGILENIWGDADSSVNFIQMEPDEGKPASDRTVVYLLYDDENLYVAFKCYEKKVTAYLGQWDDGGGDGVEVYLDTFGDKRTSYLLRVNARAIQGDAMIYNDGRNRDWDWDGVWYASSKIYRWGYVVEIEIPFKSLRYKKELTEWGVNFSRYINEKGEKTYWAPVKRTEGLRVSKFGILKGIHPKSHGRFLEIYPVALGRYDKYIDTPAETRPHIGLDLAWSPSPESYFQITTNPDFGEIEADPYELNLSKYRLYFKERRPFFIEGSDLFQVFSREDFNIGPFIRLFYSRNIGRKLHGGEEVPISIASKFLFKSKGYEGGLLLARTEPTVSDTESEALSYYGVGRFKWSIFGNSTIGFLVDDKEQMPSHHVRVLSSDLSLRSSSTQLQLVASESYNDSILGKFLRGNFSYNGNRWFGVLDGSFIGKNFEINEIGYVPVLGQMTIGGFLGPQWYPEGGIFRSFMMGFGGGASRESEEGVWEKGIMLFVNPVFKNRWGTNFNFNIGEGYEQGQNYTSRGFNFNMWSDWTKDLQGGVYSGGGYDYNYNLEFFAWHYWAGGWMNYQFQHNISGSITSNNTVEMNPRGRIEEITSILSPRLGWSITRDLHLAIYQEFVGTRSTRKVERIRLGGLLSFQLAPKSWFYLALNDLEERDEDFFVPTERISLVKIRYLILF